MSVFLDKIKALLGLDTLAPQDTNVTDELKGAGVAFGSMIQAVGKSVADTQAKMDETSGRIASAMASTKVDVVRAVVTTYNDDGTINDVDVNIGQTSALALALPPALAYSKVRIEGKFFASEFSQAGESNVNVTVSNAKVNVGLSPFSFAGSNASGSVTNTSRSTETGSSSDTAVGMMSMTAQVLPKTVQRIPDAPLVFRGPRISAVESGGALGPLEIGTGEARQFIRLQAFDLVYDKAGAAGGARTPIANKLLAIDCGDLEWFIPADPIPAGATTVAGMARTGGSGQSPATDTAGRLRIVAMRVVKDNTAPAENFTLSASIGVVRQQLPFRL
jgi:hypothetical protein